MLKKLFLSTVCLCLGLVAKAEDTDVSKYENVVFPVSTTGYAGSTVTVSVEMNNNVSVTGFQFDIFLPEGITVATDDGFYLIELSEARTTSRKTDYFSSSFNEEVGAPRVLCNSTQSYTFDGNSGEVCTIKLNIGEDVTDGNYPIIFKNIVISDVNSVAYYVDEPVEATLTVRAATYEEGYSVEILPFAFTGDAAVRKSIIMANKTAITNIAFDVEVPSYFTDNSLCFVSSVNDDIFWTNYEISSNVVHVTIEVDPNCSEGTENAIANFGIRKKSGATAGVYPITIKNIQLTDVSGSAYLVAPYTTEIFVGDAPKATATDGVVAFHGNYGGATEYALLKAALPTGATIDLTEVSAMAEDATALQTDNVIVTADAVAYGRTLTNEWGTLCLPFAVNSDEKIQLYEMYAASSTALSFEKVASVPANTPSIFRASGEGFSVKNANDGSFEVDFATANPTVNITPSVEKWVINGSYVDELVDVSSLQAYALSGGEFHKVTSKINVKAFHAWLQNNGAPMGAVIRIEEGTDGIEFVEQEDGSVKLIYDLQGRLLNNGEHQQMYIENGKKVINKK